MLESWKPTQVVVSGNHELSLDPRTWEEAAEYMDQAGETRQSTEQVQNKFYNLRNRYKIHCTIYGTGAKYIQLYMEQFMGH